MVALANALQGQGFSAFEQEAPNFRAFSSNAPHEMYAVQEFVRFLSVAGTLRQNFNDVPANDDERMFVHIPLRSLLEGFFWMLYIFEPAAAQDRANRFSEQLGEFQRQYLKLYNDLDPQHQAYIAAPQAGWGNNPKARDAAALLVAQRNTWGQKMDFLYFTYRVASFDTHGRIAPVLFEKSFGPGVPSFPFLKLQIATDLVANAYLNIWNDIK